MHRTIQALVFGALCIAPAPAAGGSLAELAVVAVGSDSDRAAAAISELRAAGPAGLEALCEAHGNWLRRYDADEVFHGDDLAAWTRLRAALDAVARQRDSHSARLYWYTDLEAARTAAQAANKPILSLRLLGNLDEELSCANSRFFRSVLYANQEVSRVLRENFVLHWQSVRPVPVLTIDFGDGRKLTRTITGNSIHFVLAPDGRVIDGIPGLIAPRVFLDHLSVDLNMVRSAPIAPAAPNWGAERVFIRRARALAVAWEGALAHLALPAAEREGRPHAAHPGALEAAPLAFAKRAEDLPTLESIASQVERLEAQQDSTAWLKLAEVFQDVARLDEGSRRLVRNKCREGEAIEPTIARFEQSIAADTAFNEFRLHRQVFEWLARDPAVTVETLTERAYAELFLTPSSDPWLGLLPAGVYSALPNGGVGAR